MGTKKRTGKTSKTSGPLFAKRYREALEAVVANAEAPERLRASLEEAAEAASRELKRLRPARVGDAFLGAAIEAAAAANSASVMEHALSLAGQAGLPFGEQTWQTFIKGGAHRYVKTSALYAEPVHEQVAGLRAQAAQEASDRKRQALHARADALQWSAYCVHCASDSQFWELDPGAVPPKERAEARKTLAAYARKHDEAACYTEGPVNAERRLRDKLWDLGDTVEVGALMVDLSSEFSVEANAPAAALALRFAIPLVQAGFTELFERPGQFHPFMERLLHLAVEHGVSVVAHQIDEERALSEEAGGEFELTDEMEDLLRQLRGDEPLVEGPAPRRSAPPPARPGVIAGDVLFIPKKATTLADVRVEDPVSVWSECWVEAHIEDGRIIVEAAGECDQEGTVPTVVNTHNQIGDEGDIGTRYFADCRLP